MSFITDLVQLGTGGAIIAVIVIFLKYIEKRDREWQAFFQAIVLKKDVPLEKLSEAVQVILSEIREHDAMERAKLDEMSKVIHGKH